jgi:hypothetical protein
MEKSFLGNGFWRWGKVGDGKFYKEKLIQKLSR